MESTRVYGGRYEARERVGRGGQAAVYKAWDTRMNRDVALKVVHFSSREEEEIESTLDIFRHEIHVTGRLNHPNIIQVHDFGLDREAGAAYMVMQYLDGRSLREMLQAERPPNPEQAFRIISTLTRALNYLHSNDVIHRDLKPSNIFWQHGVPVILDFGISAAQDRTATLTASGLMGSQPYLCPEMVTREAGKYRRHPRRDVWGLGLIAFELCTGQPLFSKEADQMEIAGRLANPRELFGEIEDRLGMHPLKKLVLEILRAETINLGWCDWWNSNAGRATPKYHRQEPRRTSSGEGKWKSRGEAEQEARRKQERDFVREVEEHIVSTIPAGWKGKRRGGDGEDDVPAELAEFKWNWGAFGLSVPWCFMHGRIGLAVFQIVMASLSIFVIPGLVLLGISIHLGANGHRIAWKSGRFKSPDEQIACQRLWTNWFIALMILSMTTGFGTSWWGYL